MKYGFKKINIEAPFPTTQCGHSCQTTMLSTFKDHLYARVFSFKDDNNWLIHLSMDLLAFTVEYRNLLQEKIRKRLNNQNIHLITSTTHTHYANNVRDKNYVDWLLPILEDGIVDMEYEEVGEVKASYQRIKCNVVGYSRISGYETGNEFLVLIRFYSNDKPLLNWVINNCHPTILAANSPFFSAEYPGYVLSLLEKNHSSDGDNTFSLGPSGDISSRFTRSGQNYESMVELAEKLYLQVDELMKKDTEKKPLTLIYKEEDMVYEHEFNPIDMSKVRADLSPREMETIKIGQQMREKLSQTKQFLGMPLAAQILSCWDLGCVKLIFFPNEIFSEYLNELDLDKEYLLSYSNGYGPYILPVDFKYITYEMFIDTTTRDTKLKIKKMLKKI